MTRAYFLLALLLTGCATSPHGMNADTAKEIIKLGIIESVTPITMDNSSGGTAGSIAGQVGGIYSRTVVGVVLGSVLGGTVGSQAGLATKPGVEIWVKLDADGSSLYVMQAVGNDIFKVGDPVRVVRKQGDTKVEINTPSVAQ